MKPCYNVITGFKKINKSDHVNAGVLQKNASLRYIFWEKCHNCVISEFISLKKLFCQHWSALKKKFN